MFRDIISKSKVTCDKRALKSQQKCNNKPWQ